MTGHGEKEKLRLARKSVENRETANYFEERMPGGRCVTWPQRAARKVDYCGFQRGEECIILMLDPNLNKEVASEMLSSIGGRGVSWTSPPVLPLHSRES
jgi:hypothetical protein